MSFWETAGKVGKAVARGTADSLASNARRYSRNEKFSDEQREAYRQFANDMDHIHDYFSDHEDNEY